MPMTQIYSMRADAWSALGSCVAAGAALITLAIAIAAAVIAWKQVGEMRATREDAAKQERTAREQAAKSERAAREHATELADRQAQPNVVAFIEANKIEWQFAELVIKNFGLTPAYDVDISIMPTPQVSPEDGNEEPTELYVPTKIRFLAPGQEWRTWWDFGKSRMGYNKRCDDSGNAPLEMSHEAELAYKDEKGKSFRTASVLSFEIFANTRRARFRTVDDIGRSLEKLNSSVASCATRLGE